MWRSKCQMHSNGCFPLTFYFLLAFIKTSGSLEPTTCTCAAITWSTNAHPEMVHSNSLKATVTGGARLFEEKDACIMSNWVLVFIMHMNSETRLLGVCLLCAVFQICEQPISISFLINVTSPLFNHTAYRHVLESQQKKKKTTFLHRAALNGRWLMILVTMQLQLGHPLLTDISAHVILIIEWI